MEVANRDHVTETRSDPLDLPNRLTSNHDRPGRTADQDASGQRRNENAAAVWTVESLVWGRNRGACYPHRRCNCRRYRKYAELASICCDLDDPFLVWTSTDLDPMVLPDEVAARKMINFHMEQLFWHHSAFHGPTFADQCEIYWRSGTVVHRLWMALYSAVLAVRISSVWSG